MKGEREEGEKRIGKRNNEEKGKEEGEGVGGGTEKVKVIRRQTYENRRRKSAIQTLPGCLFSSCGKRIKGKLRHKLRNAA